MWILLDNYDSFTYILHHYLLQTGAECIVRKNDELTVAELAAMNPERLIVSPGPETPLQAGITLEAIAHFHDKIPILGVCLGHQALGMHFGAKLIHIPYPMHGKTSQVTHNDHPLFYLRRGLLRAQTGDYSNAIMDMSHAIKINPRYAEAWYWRGMIKHRSGQMPCDDLNQARNLGLSEATDALIEICNTH